MRTNEIEGNVKDLSDRCDNDFKNDHDDGESDGDDEDEESSVIVSTRVGRKKKTQNDELVEVLMDKLGECLETAKLEVLQQLNIFVTPEELEWLQKVQTEKIKKQSKSKVQSPISQCQSIDILSYAISDFCPSNQTFDKANNDDEELNLGDIFEREVECLLSYWIQEVVLRMKINLSSLTKFIQEKKKELEKKNENTTSKLKNVKKLICEDEELLRQISQLKQDSKQKDTEIGRLKTEIEILKGTLDRRDNILKEQRKKFYQEIILLKQQISKLGGTTVTSFDNEDEGETKFEPEYNKRSLRNNKNRSKMMHIQEKLQNFKKILTQNHFDMKKILSSISKLQNQIHGSIVSSVPLNDTSLFESEAKSIELKLHKMFNSSNSEESFSNNDIIDSLRKQNMDLMNEQKKMQKIVNIANRLKKQHILKKRAAFYQEQREEYDKEGVLPPEGRIVLVFTDVQGSTRLWESGVGVMSISIKLHNQIVRRLLKQWDGYEVKTEGDSFMCAFQSIDNAINFCLKCQIQLVEAPWPEELLRNTEARVECNEDGLLLFRGLRVRMGVHVGEPIVEKDPVTGRGDYFGPMVNRAARISSHARGGQIAISYDVWNEIQDKVKSLEYCEVVWSQDNGMVKLKGFAEPERITFILPDRFKSREFSSIAVSESSTLEGELNILELDSTTDSTILSEGWDLHSLGNIDDAYSSKRSSFSLEGFITRTPNVSPSVKQQEKQFPKEKKKNLPKEAKTEEQKGKVKRDNGNKESQEKMWNSANLDFQILKYRAQRLELENQELINALNENTELSFVHRTIMKYEDVLSRFRLMEEGNTRNREEIQKLKEAKEAFLRLITRYERKYDLVKFHSYNMFRENLLKGIIKFTIFESDDEDEEHGEDEDGDSHSEEDDDQDDDDDDVDDRDNFISHDNNRRHFRGKKKPKRKKRSNNSGYTNSVKSSILLRELPKNQEEYLKIMFRDMFHSVEMQSELEEKEKSKKKSQKQRVNYRDMKRFSLSIPQSYEVEKERASRYLKESSQTMDIANPLISRRNNPQKSPMQLLSELTKHKDQKHNESRNKKKEGEKKEKNQSSGMSMQNMRVTRDIMEVVKNIEDKVKEFDDLHVEEENVEKDFSKSVVNPQRIARIYHTSKRRFIRKLNVMGDMEERAKLMKERIEMKARKLEDMRRQELERVLSTMKTLCKTHSKELSTMQSNFIDELESDLEAIVEKIGERNKLPNDNALAGPKNYKQQKKYFELEHIRIPIGQRSKSPGEASDMISDEIMEEQLITIKSIQNPISSSKTKGISTSSGRITSMTMIERAPVKMNVHGKGLNATYSTTSEILKEMQRSQSCPPGINNDQNSQLVTSQFYPNNISLFEAQQGIFPSVVSPYAEKLNRKNRETAMSHSRSIASHSKKKKKKSFDAYTSSIPEMTDLSKHRSLISVEPWNT